MAMLNSQMVNCPEEYPHDLPIQNSRRTVARRRVAGQRGGNALVTLARRFYFGGDGYDGYIRLNKPNGNTLMVG
jgi:hypothetical protein